MKIRQQNLFGVKRFKASGENQLLSAPNDISAKSEALLADRGYRRLQVGRAPGLCATPEQSALS
jgi:hypothetical protein